MISIICNFLSLKSTQKRDMNKISIKMTVEENGFSYYFIFVFCLLYDLRLFMYISFFHVKK